MIPSSTLMGLSWLDRETSHILQCSAINLLACSQLFDPHLALSLQNPATAYLPLGIPNFLSFLGQRPFHLFLKQIAKFWRVQLYPMVLIWHLPTIHVTS